MCVFVNKYFPYLVKWVCEYDRNTTGGNTPRKTIVFADSYLRHVAMCVPNSFDEDKDYLSVERPSTELRMNAQASLFLQAVKAYCQRTKMRKINSGIPKFPDCLTKEGGKTGRVLIVGIVWGILGRGLSTNISDNIVTYSKACHETGRVAIDLVGIIPFVSEMVSQLRYPSAVFVRLGLYTVNRTDIDGSTIE